MNTIHESKSLNQKSIHKHILQHIFEACKAPYPFKAVHQVPVTMPLLSIACQRFFPPLPKLVGPANYFADST